MSRRRFLITWVLTLCLAALVTAEDYGYRGPEHDHNTWISLINATPYRWVRTYNHSYQLVGWNSHWPPHIHPGQSHEMLALRSGGTFGKDSAAEVVYELEGTSKPMALQVEYRRGIRASIGATFLGELETLHNEKRTSHDLGFQRRPGGVGFILAGKEGEFVSNDGPMACMQATLPSVGHLSLRELNLPRSHNSGMWKAVAPIGVGIRANTVTQHDELRHQLGNGGVRVLDVRAVKWRGEFRAYHASELGALGWQGMVGAGIQEMIDIVNRFTKAVPGELLIWDLHPHARNADKIFSRLCRYEVWTLLRMLRGLEHRLPVPDEDLTLWPLSRFIGNGSSAVLVRVPDEFFDISVAAFPGGKHGFVSSKNFPMPSRWSNMNDVDMAKDQVDHLRINRPSRGERPWHTQWLLTQQGGQAVFPLESIPNLNRAAWRAFYHEFWNALTDETYPNWVSMDNIHHSQQKAMAMAINLCFGARRCGRLGGKVKGLPAVGR